MKTSRAAIVCLCLLSQIAPGPILAQQLEGRATENPIYIADSPIATESMLRLPELIAQQNLDEAVRLVDEVITTLGDRLILGRDNDPDRIHIPVRQRLHRFVRTQPQLLEAYRRRFSPAAAVWLEQGDWRRVARDAWLTEPGFIATLHHAQTLIEGAHFFAGVDLLSELENHPDAEALAPKAAAMAHLGARYIDQPNAWALADRWAQRARRDQPGRDAIAAPPSDPRDTARSLVWDDQPTPPVSLTGIVPGPLAQAALTPEMELGIVTDPAARRASGANWKPTAWVAPYAEGSTVYTNDGVTISAFDRFTLRPIWRVQIPAQGAELPVTPEARQRLGRIIEDQTSVTSDGSGSLYAAAGVPKSGARDGDQRLYKLDQRTGATQWAVDIRELDPALANASIRGPVIAQQGVVVAAARTSNRRQRLISVTIVGLDAATGQPLYVRPIASAGSLPFQQMGQLAHTPVVKDGVAYYTDHIGLAFAVRIATGAVVWARPLPAPDLYARFSRPSFAGNTPVINTHGLFALTTDGTRLIHVDPRTGRTLGARRADLPAESMYLVAIDDDAFASVSPNRVVYYRAGEFETARAIRSPELGGEDGLRGRVVLAGDRLLAPVGAGVRVLDPTQPSRTELIELDKSGNVLALNGQLIVADEMDLTNFLAWETASRMLEQRIAQDPAAAITLAELAYRAQRAQQILPAVERAMRELRAQARDQRAALEAELFGVVRSMVAPETQDTADRVFSLDAKDQSQLLEHLGALAQTHEQIVAHRMALGAHHERVGEHEQAVRAYQDILDQPTLRTAMWEGSGIAVRGGLEATRRVGAILGRVGYAPYRPIDKLAGAERDFLVGADDPDAIEQLARRYPWSTIAPALWSQTAALLSGRGLSPAAIASATEGIDAARKLTELGLNVDQQTIDELAQHAITGLIATSRAREANALATALAKDFPNLTIRINGERVDPDQLAQAASLANKLPRLGDAFLRDAKPVLVTGSPVKPATRADPGGVVVYAPQLGRLEYLRAGRGAFEPFWSRHTQTNEAPLIPWQGESRTLVLWPEGSESMHTGVLEAINTTTGETAWSITDLREALGEQSTRVADDIARTDYSFPAPAIGPVPIRQMLVLTDGHTVVICDRIGRAMGVDLYSGQRLWQRDLPVNRLHDMDLGGGVLGICGLMVVDRAVNQRDGSVTSIAASIDPRTGETIQAVDRFGQQPRWVRAAPGGNLYVATTQRIVALNTKGGSVDWVVNDDDLVESAAGWVSADHLYVLDVTNTLWAIGLDSGVRARDPLDVRSRISPRGWVSVRPMIDRTLLTSSRGLIAVSAQQHVIAADPFEALPTIVDTAIGGTNIALIEQPSVEERRSLMRVHLLDQAEARLLDTITLSIPSALDRLPTSAQAINGGVLVGFGEVSVFVRTQFKMREDD